MSPTIPAQSLTTARRSNAIDVKGGERTASEWEELEKLSKDELIIELVKARRDMRNICRVLDEISNTGASHFMYDKGEQPSESWLEKIAAYAVSESCSDELDDSDLERYGVDAVTAERFCYERDGELRW